jgi:tetratricopeptide (TPR) repeat protein
MFMTRPASENAMAVAAPIVIVGALLVVWVVNVPALARAQNVIAALTTQQLTPNANGGFSPTAKDPRVNLTNFQTSLGENVWPGTLLGQQEVTEQLLQYATTISGSTSVDPSVKQDTFNTAQAAAVAIMQQRPHDARLELFDGAFLDSYQQFGLSLTVLQQALADSPKKQQILFEIGVAYLNSGDIKNALTTLKAAFDEEPTFTDARILYAAGLIQSGDMTDADALLTAGFGSVIVDDQRLLQVYTNTKHYDRAIAIWQLRLRKNPENVQYELGLAATYFTMGDKANAIVALKRAEQLSPSLASQIESVITQIQNGTLK